MNGKCKHTQELSSLLFRCAGGDCLLELGGTVAPGIAWNQAGACGPEANWTPSRTLAPIAEWPAPLPACQHGGASSQLSER